VTDVEKAKGHTVKCALMPPCEGSGFAVMTEDKKLYKLDANGNAKAGEILRKTKLERGVAVNIEGEAEGETLKVAKISEAS
jgi:hypothetical protein